MCIYILNSPLCSTARSCQFSWIERCLHGWSSSILDVSVRMFPGKTGMWASGWRRNPALIWAHVQSQKGRLGFFNTEAIRIHHAGWCYLLLEYTSSVSPLLVPLTIANCVLQYGLNHSGFNGLKRACTRLWPALSGLTQFSNKELPSGSTLLPLRSLSMSLKSGVLWKIKEDNSKSDLLHPHYTGTWDPNWKSCLTVELWHSDVHPLQSGQDLLISPKSKCQPITNTQSRLGLKGSAFQAAAPESQVWWINRNSIIFKREELPELQWVTFWGSNRKYRNHWFCLGKSKCPLFERYWRSAINKVGWKSQS